jgi:hypothetical protein
VQEELLAKKGLDVYNVLITSDEEDPEWWAEVAKLGWKSPNHTNTEAEYGRWCVYIYIAIIMFRGLTVFYRYPVLIDAVIQSNGIGFVGTDRSTMSGMAERRSQSWHGGVTRMVKWGFIGADDH